MNQILQHWRCKGGENNIQCNEAISFSKYCAKHIAGPSVDKPSLFIAKELENMYCVRTITNNEIKTLCPNKIHPGSAFCQMHQPLQLNSLGKRKIDTDEEILFESIKELMTYKKKYHDLVKRLKQSMESS